MTVVEIQGLELHGRHGALDEEREAGQRFLFDVRLEVGDAAARSDRLEDAVDYRHVVAAVRDVSDGRRFTLLETLARAVAEELMARFPLHAVSVRVRKPEVRLEAPVEWTAASVELP
jgi:dihydroneopterin aldolase